MTISLGYLIGLIIVGFFGGAALVVDGIRRTTRDVVKSRRNSRRLVKPAIECADPAISNS